MAQFTFIDGFIFYFQNKSAAKKEMSNKNDKIPEL